MNYDIMLFRGEINIKILVDADACPSKNILESIAKENGIRIIFYCCISSLFSMEYGEVILVDQGFQMVDMKIANACEKGDIVITQDYGVASMVLGKGCYAINPRGMIYDNANIDGLLMQKHISSKIRRGGGRTTNPKKRTKNDENILANNLFKLININYN